MHPQHAYLLREIKKASGKPTHHTFLDHYLGTSHPRYPINNPRLRAIARSWARNHPDLSATQVAAVLTSLTGGKSFTEKCMAGMVLDEVKPDQMTFPPVCFDRWLGRLEGWAEVDTLCTGKYSHKQILLQWPAWSKLLTRFSSSKNIHKRRASLVLLCAPLRKSADNRLLKMALRNCSRLSSEKDPLIFKAISWVLRSAVRTFPGEIGSYLDANENNLPKIAVRETRTKLTTGRKTKRKK